MAAGWQDYNEQSSFVAQFLWSPEFSPKTVTETYKTRLPVLVKVTSGYDGCDGMHEFAMEEVYCIVEIKKQKRVVMTDIKDRFISIPVDYHVKFHTVGANNKPEGPSRPLSEICPSDSSSLNVNLRVMFDQNQAVKFNDGADLGSKVQLGVIEYDEVYKERYLVCHPLQSNEILSDVVLIPIYVPISLSVAEGFVDAAPDSFTDWMRCVSASVQAFDTTGIQACREIVVFDESPASDYTYINPLNLFQHALLKGGSVKRDPEDSQRYLNITQSQEKKRGRVSLVGTQLPPILEQGQGRGQGQGQVKGQVKGQGIFQGQGQVKSQGQGQVKGQGISQGQGRGAGGAANVTAEAAPGPPLPPRNYTKGPSPEKDTPPPPAPALPGPRKNSGSTPGKATSPVTPTAPEKVRREEVTRPSSPLKTSGGTDPSRRPQLPLPVKDPVGQPSAPLTGSATRIVKDVEDPATKGSGPKVAPSVSAKKMVTSNAAQDYRSADSLQNRDKLGFSKDKSFKDSPGLIEDSCPLPKDRPCPLPQCEDPSDLVEYETLDEATGTPSPVDKTSKPSSGGSSWNALGDDEGLSRSPVSPIWKSVEDIPKNLNILSLSVDELCCCLGLLKMERFVETFRQNMVDGSLLLDLNNETLKEEFGMTLFDATKLMKFAKDGWRPKTQ